MPRLAVAAVAPKAAVVSALARSVAAAPMLLVAALVFEVSVAAVVF